MFFLLSFTMQAQKYQDLIIEGPSSSIKSNENREIINENCDYLVAKTSWNPDLNKVNSDQCSLYESYTSFSGERLRWIDEVKLTTEMDADLGMEVEVITFYKDGQEVEPSGFLKSQISECSSLDGKEGISRCIGHFGSLAMETKKLIDVATSLSESAPKVIKNSDESVQQELEDLKGSKKLGDIKKAKELKAKAAGIADSGKNANKLLPSLLQTMTRDYAIISGVTKTLNQLEKGL